MYLKLNRPLDGGVDGVDGAGGDSGGVAGVDALAMAGWVGVDVGVHVDDDEERVDVGGGVGGGTPSSVR